MELAKTCVTGKHIFGIYKDNGEFKVTANMHMFSQPAPRETHEEYEMLETVDEVFSGDEKQEYLSSKLR